MVWVRDEAFEHQCARHGIAFSLERRLISSLNIATSLHNNSRLDPLDDDVVERYAADMVRGDGFPPIIITATNDILAGNHRTAAAKKADLKEVVCYVVDDKSTNNKPSLVRAIITRGDNRRHGLAQSDDEMIHHAVVFREQYNCSFEQIAEYLHVPQNKLKWLETQLRAIELQTNIQRHGADVRSLSRGHFVKMLPIATNTEHMLAVCELVNEFVLSQESTDQLVRDIKRTRTAHTRKAVVDKWRSNLTQLSPSSSKPTRTRLLEFFVGSKPKCLHHFLEAGNDGKPIASLADTQLTLEDIPVFLKQWNEVKSKIDKICQEGVAYQQRMNKKSRVG